MEDKELDLTNGQGTDSAGGGPDASAGKENGGQEKEECAGACSGQEACEEETKDMEQEEQPEKGTVSAGRFPFVMGGLIPSFW